MSNFRNANAVLDYLDKETLIQKTTEAICILHDEYRHVCHHLMAANKDACYYKEQEALADALALGIYALRSQLDGMEAKA